MKNKKIALFPGSFDPIHQGHINILEKALKIFDYIYVVITNNPDKKYVQSFCEKQKQVVEKLAHLKNVEVLINQNELTAKLAQKINANFIIRSARNNLDFEYELELAIGNKIVNKELETILFFPDEETIQYSSTLERHKKILKIKEK